MTWSTIIIKLIHISCRLLNKFLLLKRYEKIYKLKYYILEDFFIDNNNLIIIIVFPISPKINDLKSDLLSRVIA